MLNRLKIGAVIGVILIVLFYMLAPNYPEIENQQTSNEVKSYLKSVLQVQAKNLNMEAMADNRQVTVEARKAYKDIGVKWDKCNNDKACLIEVYEDYMDEWCTSGLRKYARAKWMENKFGVIGQEITHSFGGLY